MCAHFLGALLFREPIPGVLGIAAQGKPHQQTTSCDFGSSCLLGKICAWLRGFCWEQYVDVAITDICNLF